MAIPRKDSRKIAVAGYHPIWRIRRKSTYSQALAWSPMTIAVASASGRGSKLILELDVTRPDAWLLPSVVSVTPAAPPDSRPTRSHLVTRGTLSWR
jgi:hypothetical protein